MNSHFMNLHAAPDPVCADLDSILALLPLGELSAEEEATARAHVATCVRCQRRLAEYGLVYASLRHSSPTSTISRPLVNVDDIILSAALSDDEDVNEGTSSVTMRITIRSFTHRLSRRSTVLSRMGALAAMLLVTLLASTLFHLRGAPNSTTRMLKGGGTLTEYTLPSNSKLPGYVIAGPDGNIWFTETGMIGRITLGGAVTEFPLPENADPSGIAIGPGRSLLVIVDNEILRVSMTGHVTKIPLPASINRPIGSVVTARDGTIWFAIPRIIIAPADSTESPLIGRISPQGSLTTYDTRQAISGEDIGMIAALSDGSVWIYTEIALGRIALDGKITLYDSTVLHSLDSLATAGTTDDKGDLWIVGGRSSPQGTGGRVVQYAPDGSTKVWSFSATLNSDRGGSVVTVMGRDGNLWTAGNGVILRTTLGGAVTAFQLPNDVIISDMTVGADNNLWISEGVANTIGRIHFGS